MNRRHRTRAAVAAALLTAGLIGPAVAPLRAQSPIVVTSSGALRLAFEDPAVTAIELGADIAFCDFDEPMVRISAEDLTLDGAGFGIVQLCETGIFRSLGAGALTFENITIRGGRSESGGGAIFSGGSVSVVNSTFEDNICFAVQGGGAIQALGAVTVTDSAFRDNEVGAFGNGGAIDAAGAITVSRSVFTGNRAAAHGGAIFASSGTHSVTHSTLQGNLAGSFGGAIAVSGDLLVSHSTLVGNGAGDSEGVIGRGGAIAALEAGSQAKLMNVTVSGNRADEGGGVFAAGVLELLHATVIDNAAPAGGNLSSFGGDLSLSSFGSVVALPGNGGENCSLAPGATAATGYNLTDDASCGFLAETDIVDSDPELAELADNGGPTVTLTPRSGSPLIDAILAGDCHPDVPDDQRGVQRPRLGGCDIGAVEVDLPLAVADVYAGVPRFETFIAPHGLLANDLGPPGMSVEVLSSPAHGALAVHPEGGFAYTLADPEDPATSDGFTYVATLAGAGGERHASNVATVTLDFVDPPAGAPPLPVELGVDLLPLGSDGNGVLEPGELVEVAPRWLNRDVEALLLSGIASDLGGPPGATYNLAADRADYGEVAPGALGDCRHTGLCYRAVVGLAGGGRPAKHWDAGFDEALAFVSLTTGGSSQPWPLHIGDSFVDVPRTSPFYRFVETLLHHQICSGCSASEFCPAAAITRAQMAVYLLLAREGGDFEPPACDPQSPVFEDVPTDSPFCPWIWELVRRGAAAGCGGETYCPGDPVTRAQMAVLLLRTLEGPGFTPQACSPGSPPFADVPAGGPFCPWIQELVVRGISAGCGEDAYCPADPVSRAQMAVFLSRTFGLVLYGP